MPKNGVTFLQDTAELVIIQVQSVLFDELYEAYPGAYSLFTSRGVFSVIFVIVLGSVGSRTQQTGSISIKQTNPNLYP